MLKHTQTTKIVIAALVTGILALGCATSPDGADEPTVQFSKESPVHISPASSPGVQDIFLSAVATHTAEDAVITGYELEIQNAEGETVYSVAIEAGDGAVDEMRATGRSALPSRIVWHGRDNRNRFVPEGAYLISISVTDSADRTARSAPMSIVVDNTPPEAEVETGFNVFSPDGDGSRDVLPIRQYGEDASRWSGRIVNNAGTTMEMWDWEYDLPEELRWDGTRVTGSTVRDGEYTYILTGNDDAGNTITVRQENIRVNTQDRALTINANRPAFSPNGDGVRDTITYTPGFPDDADPLNWEFSVVNPDGTTVMKRSGGSTVPSSFTFTGIDGEERLPEGAYTADLRVTFRNGETETAAAPEVALDVTPPEVAVAPQSGKLSPDSGDDAETMEITIDHDSDGAYRWHGAVIPADDDDPILTATWTDTLPETFSWNGQTGRGASAGTGQYRYTLRASDRAGNQRTVQTEPFLLDREAPSVDVDVTPAPFYPGADNRASTLEISIQTDDRSGIEEQRIVVYGPQGDVFTRIDGDGETVTWNGRNAEGDLPQSARDYTVAVTVTDSVGNRSTVEESVPIGILVEEDQAGDLRFRITGIRFAPFEADFSDLDDRDVVEKNRETLDQIASFLQDYPDQEIRVEGHAVHIYQRGDLKEREQDEVLLPLSQKRAQVIVDALIDRGVDGTRLTAVGRGGAEPLVPHSDRENRWKNRRVEFELTD
jgi:outer membrane protein OmpA-like peptidoglycan-associated protein/flagellar hook assembly protein FlgD